MAIGERTIFQASWYDAKYLGTAVCFPERSADVRWRNMKPLPKPAYLMVDWRS